ncbi:hypothetical protein Btru_055315 [Bulinus truncatus]|nr:hypothetical protein Btru_055315 [Bulinus truncatus]
MLFIYSFVILLIFGILSLDVTGFSHLDVTWAKINQDVNMTFNLRLAGEQELVYIRFKPEGTTYVLDFISIVTSTREVQYHPSYKNRLIVETKDYPTVDVTMKMCQLTDAGDYVCMNGDKEIADCGFRVHVWGKCQIKDSHQQPTVSTCVG